MVVNMVKIYNAVCPDCTRGKVVEFCGKCKGTGREHGAKKTYPRLDRIVFNNIPTWRAGEKYAASFRNSTGKWREVNLNYQQFRRMLTSITAKDGFVQHECWLNVETMKLHIEFTYEGPNW